jgi:hypothetical protein
VKQAACKTHFTVYVARRLIVSSEVIKDNIDLIIVAVEAVVHISGFNQVADAAKPLRLL